MYHINIVLTDVVFQHRQLNGEDLQGLTLQELQKIEEHLKRGLSNVSKLKVYASNVATFFF